MRILVDVTHPAHVHFFKHAIHAWQRRGHEIIITARHKDVAVDLLSAYGFDFIDLGPARKGFIGLSAELAIRNTKLTRVIRRMQPDVLTAIAGVFIAQTGWLTRTPSVVFTDTERDALSNAITFPFASAICTPSCFQGAVPSHKHIVYEGYHELAYLHPHFFQPDPEALKAFGLHPDERYIVVRLVSLESAVYFRGGKGVRDAMEIVRRLESFGRVLISAEEALPSQLAPYRLTHRPELIHHLLYYAALFFGDSLTMASECAMLGTPAISISTITAGTIQEQAEVYGLVFAFTDPYRGQEQALAKAEELLSLHESNVWRERRQRLLAEKIDVTPFIVDAVEQFGPRERILRKKP
ncbi:MAG: DUF354 domain-containing protein [Chloroflexi bacterium]|nr:DUF354 domain-containing protein [Chloroflexota bacterium]